MKFLATALLYFLEIFVVNRPCDLVIRPGYMHRWYIIPRNKYFNIYFHEFVGSDDPIYHDHPWYSWGFILEGSYVEHTPYGDRFLRNGNTS